MMIIITKKYLRLPPTIIVYYYYYCIIVRMTKVWNAQTVSTARNTNRAAAVGMTRRSDGATIYYTNNSILHYNIIYTKNYCCDGSVCHFPFFRSFFIFRLHIDKHLLVSIWSKYIRACIISAVVRRPRVQRSIPRGDLQRTDDASDGRRKGFRSNKRAGHRDYDTSYIILLSWRIITRQTDNIILRFMLLNIIERMTLEIFHPRFFRLLASISRCTWIFILFCIYTRACVL